MGRTIATIGYEGVTLAEFIDALERARIATLIDVREVALSRKKGFSKSHLSAALEARGIRYVHLRALGDPKDGRLAARAGNYAHFRKIFGAHMRTAPARDALATAARLVTGSSSCLMCFEADPAQCHRTIVANALATATGLTISPLSVATPVTCIAA